MNRRLSTTLAAALVSALALTACGGGGDPLEDDASATGGAEGEGLIIGSANFPENVLRRAASCSGDQPVMPGSSP